VPVRRLFRFTLLLDFPPPCFPPRAHQNHVRPLGGQKVHRTFCCFRLSPRKGEGKFACVCRSGGETEIPPPLAGGGQGEGDRDFVNHIYKPDNPEQRYGVTALTMAMSEAQPQFAVSGTAITGERH